MKEVLLLYSGGRDSFLSACKLLSSGFKVRLITFNNGCISGKERIYDSSKLLTERFENVSFEGVYDIIGIKHMLTENLCYLDFKSLSKYENCTYNQVRCLCCKCAMYVAAVKYCIVNNINYMADGSRLSQGFFVENIDFLKELTNFCKEFSISLELPVISLSSDYTRKLELHSYGFDSQLYEMQCALGMPIKKNLSDNEIKSTMEFFKDMLLENMITLSCSKDSFYDYLKFLKER